MQYLYLEERVQKRPFGLSRVFFVKCANLAKLSFKLFFESLSHLENVFKPGMPPWFHENHFLFYKSFLQIARSSVKTNKH